MERDMCADMKMEEGYMRMSIEYNNDNSKIKIHKAIAKIEKQMQVFPSVLRKSISNNAGNFSIEFETDNCEREGGNFCDAVMKELNIKSCAY
jgi:hypothetical protein